MTRPAVSRSAEVIQAWLKAQVADLIGVEPDGVDVDQTFASFGLSSLAAVSLSGDLDEWLGIPLPATLAWDYPTISKLSERLANFSIEEESPVVPPLTAPTSEAIAIVGIACRFPGAADLDAFWDLLCAGTDAVT